MSDSMTNRHEDELRIGQNWLDHPARTTRRTLRIDRFGNVGTAYAAAVCTVVSAHEQDTREITEPGREVSIKIDSLHTTASGKGYLRADTDSARLNGIDPTKVTNERCSRETLTAPGVRRPRVELSCGGCRTVDTLGRYRRSTAVARGPQRDGVGNQCGTCDLQI